MTTRDRKGGSRQDPDADQLAAAWNEITAGRRPSRDGDHADLTAPVELLHAAVPDVPPRPAFMQDLREQLMQATLPVDAPISEPVRHLSANPMVVQSRTSMAAHVPKSLRKAAARWLPIAATITLLMATAAGAYFSIDRPNNEPNGTNIAAPSAGTSESSGSTFLEECDVIGAYFPCVADPWVTEGLIVRANLSGEDLAVSNVQMQGWELDRLGHITFGEPANPVTGVGVDIVTSGAYLAVFSVPVVVGRPLTGGGEFEYPREGSAVELSRGDSVTYPIGSKLEVNNPLEGTRLHFKTILIYAGDPSPDNLAGGDYFAQVEGEGSLPMPLSDYETPEVSIALSYVNPNPIYPFSPSDTSFATHLLGPVAPYGEARGPGIGFVVWAIVRQG